MLLRSAGNGAGCLRVIAAVLGISLVSGVEAFVTSPSTPHIPLHKGSSTAAARLRACARSRGGTNKNSFQFAGVDSAPSGAAPGGIRRNTLRLAVTTGRGERAGSLGMITLEMVKDSQIPEMANFFVSNFWEEDVAPSQKRSLVRELVADYRSRYGALIGKRKLPSLLVAARSEGEIVGCVAIEVSVCVGERVGMKARGINPNDPKAELRPVLANLAVARSARRKGLAKRLVKRCEDAAKEWGYDEVLLLVEQNNSKARKLYQKLGYRTLFKDTEAKKIVPSDYAIRDVPCINVCMRRDLKANIFSGLFNMLARA